jgi:hypothetical protein
MSCQSCRRWKSSLLLTVSLVALGTASAAEARTWHVERDGSGDFTVIQDAVDAAASGDTIRIGPGRFNEGQIVTVPGWSHFVRVLVSQPELTLIGSGESTVIGQEEPWDLSQGLHKGIATGAWFGNASITVVDIRFENMGQGIYASETHAHIIGCSFASHYYSISSLNGQLLKVDGCRFDQVARDGRHIVAIGQAQAVVHDSEFVLAYVHQWHQLSVSFTNVADGYLENCRFDGGNSGIHTAGIGSVTHLQDCSFYMQRGRSASVGYNALLTLDGCVFRDVAIALRTWDWGDLRAYNCVIESVQDYSVDVEHSTTVFVNHCDLASGERGTVRIWDCILSPPPVLDLTENFWGTEDPDEIAALIHDRNDDEAVCAYVNFIPFRSHSVPVQQQTWTEVKGLFRN